MIPLLTAADLRDSQAVRGASVLVVDDDPDMRRVIRTALERLDMKVREAGDGVAVLRSAFAERPDALVLDLGLPLLHGFKVLRAIRTNPLTSSVPIVVLTGLQDPDLSLWNAADALRADAFLTKPVGMGELQVTVVEALTQDAPDPEVPSLYVHRGRASVDVVRKSLHLGNRVFRFSSPKCLLLLAYLLDNPEGATKRTLLRELWPQGESLGVVAVTIGRLKKELAASGAPLLIELCEQGYRLRHLAAPKQERTSPIADTF